MGGGWDALGGYGGWEEAVAGVGGNEGLVKGEAPFRAKGIWGGCLGSIAPGCEGGARPAQNGHGRDNVAVWPRGSARVLRLSLEGAARIECAIKMGVVMRVGSGRVGEVIATGAVMGM